MEHMRNNSENSQNRKKSRLLSSLLDLRLESNCSKKDITEE